MSKLSATIPVSLTVWREIPPSAFGLRGPAQLLTHLLDKTSFSDDEGRQLLTSAATNKVSAMVGVADRLGRQGGDLAFSWLTLAALAGDRAATVQVSAELARQAISEKMIGRIREARRLHHLASEWAEGLAIEVSRAFGEDRRNLLQGWLTTTGPRRPLEVVPEHEEVGPDHLVVLPDGIPSMRGERDDRQLIEAWKLLTKPLPLAEGLPADLLATVLQLEFPWMQEAVSAITEDLKLRQMVGLSGFWFRPVILVGPPGTGKTSFARRMAEISGAGYGELSAAGSSDNRLLAGTARGWGSAQPGYVLQVIRRSKVGNPVVLVDEIDKTRPDGRNGDLRQTLLGLTEPTTARAWMDECLCTPADLSAVSWVLTANDIHHLKGPLLTRLRVVNVEAPGPEHLDAVLAGVKRELEKQWKVPSGTLPEPSQAVLKQLRRACIRGASLRRLRSAYEKALGQSLRKGMTVH